MHAAPLAIERHVARPSAEDAKLVSLRGRIVSQKLFLNYGITPKLVDQARAKEFAAHAHGGIVRHL